MNTMLGLSPTRNVTACRRLAHDTAGAKECGDEYGDLMPAEMTEMYPVSYNCTKTLLPPRNTEEDDCFPCGHPREIQEDKRI